MNADHSVEVTTPATTPGPAAPVAEMPTIDPAHGTRARDASGGPGTRSRRRWLLAASGVAAVATAVYFGYPVVSRALITVSTDDAYVNAHVTYVAPRIMETVVQVRVDDNDAVKKGDLLIVLDKDVWTIAVEQAEAALDIARKSQDQQLAHARALAAEAKANHFKLVSAMSKVRNTIADLKAEVARLDEARATEKLAKIEAERFSALNRRGAETLENAEIRLTTYTQARARTRQALEAVHSMRVALELPEEPPPGKPMEDVPADLDQVHSSVVSALAAFGQNLADLGVPLPGFTENPDDYIKRIHALAPNGDLDALVARVSDNAPAVESARASVKKAEKDLARAKLDLSYCEIRADINGYVSNRNVNPGNRVAQGQRLMAVRSSEEVWVDCNFKETQLDPIRIGHPVDLYVDAYPGKVFKGRVSGFSAGTGQSLALLPAQNATGNFVKIVQRLPVRVELVHGNPPDTPLFVGLSVVPYVRINESPEGPDAGKRLREDSRAVASHVPPASAP